MRRRDKELEGRNLKVGRESSLLSGPAAVTIT